MNVGQVMYAEGIKDTCYWCGINKGLDYVIKSKKDGFDGTKEKRNYVSSDFSSFTFKKSSFSPLFIARIL